MNKAIFLSGPHGGGKSTLIVNLLKTGAGFMENDFDIDFTVDFPGILSMSSFERSLMRLYHRFFIAHYAGALSAKKGKFVLTNRSVFDSEAYISAYKELGWVSAGEFEKLRYIIANFDMTPYAIVLNPPVETIMARLNARKNSATRAGRDKIFEKEDSVEFVEMLHRYFESLRDKPNILYIEDNGEAEIQKIIAWAEKM